MMTSAPYLNNYLKCLEKLPEELQRNFTLMRNLDSRQQKLMQDIDKQANNHMAYIKGRSTNKNNVSIASIQRQFNKVKEYGDDKVQLAIQTYELVDKEIRELDIYLARFEAEIADKSANAKRNCEGGSQKREHIKTKDHETKKQITSREEEKSIKTSKKKHLKKGSSKISSTVSTKLPSVKIFDDPTKTTDSTAVKTGSLACALVGNRVTHSGEVLDMPVDPNEPTYCICNQVSFGEMIGCDNPNCPIEWFHFQCVKLRTKPKGKWFCSNCVKNKKKKITWIF